MSSEGVPALLDALFIYGRAQIRLDKSTKAALRLCNKHFKNLVDATVIEARVRPSNLNAFINTKWQGLKHLHISEYGQSPLTELPSALFLKFSQLESLNIDGCGSLTGLPKEIGGLSHLKKLEMTLCQSLVGLPSSLRQLTALEEIALFRCYSLTSKGLAPVQYLTGLTSLSLAGAGNLRKFPDFLCNLASLKKLNFSAAINKLPDALGNLTNLETLELYLPDLKKLPESIGNLNALKSIDLSMCEKLTTLPESLDDLFWRKAHETEELRS